MIKNIDVKYVREDKLRFIIDDDKEMRWLSTWNVNKYGKIFLIIDKNVRKIWGNLLLKRLKADKSQKIIIFEVDPVESSKSTIFYPKLIDFLEMNLCNLSDMVIAVGGGVVLDLVGFTCSTYMRGIPFSAIPTTLIGMVDASTAGKTCLNTLHTKNILGTFYYPNTVYNNINFLKTCSPYFHRQGLSEVLKYSLLGSPKLLKVLQMYEKMPSQKLLRMIIELTIDIRVKIRKIHPQASNLGHTFGQALEKMSEYKILHGDAISTGIVIALNFGFSKGVTSKNTVEKIIDLMKKMHLNMYLDKNTDTKKMIEVMRHDKKSAGLYLNLVLLREIGRPYKDDSGYFYKVKFSEVGSFLNSFLKKYPYLTKNTADFVKRDIVKYENN